MENQAKNKAEVVAVPVKTDFGPEVSVAYLQSPTTWSGVFSSETSMGVKTPKEMKIYLNDSGGLTLLYQGKTSVVPSANVKIALLK